MKVGLLETTQLSLPPLRYRPLWFVHRICRKGIPQVTRAPLIGFTSRLQFYSSILSLFSFFPIPSHLEPPLNRLLMYISNNQWKRCKNSTRWFILLSPRLLLLLWNDSTFQRFFSLFLRIARCNKPTTKMFSDEGQYNSTNLFSTIIFLRNPLP